MEKSELQKCLGEELKKLEQFVLLESENNRGIDLIEKSLMSSLLSLGLLLLKLIIAGRLERLGGNNYEDNSGERALNKGIEIRNYVSLFGKLTISRSSYWTKLAGKFHALDRDLQLPKSSHLSYNLQEIMGDSAAETNYMESVRVLNEVLSLGLSNKSSERNITDIGQAVSSFYVASSVAANFEAVCYSASFDGKGIPKIKSKTSDINDGKDPKARLGKGEKRNVMQMATVSVTSDFVPKQRCKENILKGLIDSYLETNKVKEKETAETSVTTVIKRDENDNRWHQNIHRRAFLGQQAKAVDYGIERIKQAMQNPKSRFVVPIDAGIGLEAKVLEAVKKYGLEKQFDGIILDIIHVSEYVWSAATAILGERSKVKTPWVRSVLSDLLDSKTEKVIQDLVAIVQKGDLSDAKITQVQKTITYFTNHQHNMDYKKFIQKGYPVSSALVESACGHLVKVRMEQTGMRWSDKGAQNILDMRAVKTNGDSKLFIRFVKDKENLTSFNIAA